MNSFTKRFGLIGKAAKKKASKPKKGSKCGQDETGKFGPKNTCAVGHGKGGDAKSPEITKGQADELLEEFEGNVGAAKDHAYQMASTTGDPEWLKVFNHLSGRTSKKEKPLDLFPPIKTKRGGYTADIRFSDEARGERFFDSGHYSIWGAEPGKFDIGAQVRHDGSYVRDQSPDSHIGRAIKEGDLLTINPLRWKQTGHPVHEKGGLVRVTKVEPNAHDGFTVHYERPEEKKPKAATRPAPKSVNPELMLNRIAELKDEINQKVEQVKVRLK